MWICQGEFDQLEKLDMHLKACKIYECAKCSITNKNISEIKKHIVEEHDNSIHIWYSKMDRSNPLEKA